MVSALLKSVARGWNVIDTARNYRRGRAEAAIGEALVTLTRQGLRREQLFISTKAGYLPGVLAEMPEHILTGFACHCMQGSSISLWACAGPTCFCQKSAHVQHLPARRLACVRPHVSLRHVGLKAWWYSKATDKLFASMLLTAGCCCAADSVQELLKAGKIQDADVQSGNCMHPACLKSSLTQSLAAMHIATVRHYCGLLPHATVCCRVLSTLVVVSPCCPCRHMLPIEGSYLAGGRFVSAQRCGVSSAGRQQT